MPESDHTETRTRAAAFLAEALDLTDPAAILAQDLVAIDDDGTVAVFAAELDSSVGPAAFLIYVYAMDAPGDAGRARFDADLEVLRTAAERDAPGPRLVAHAVAADGGFLLATTPATLRALAGDPTAAASPDPSVGGDPLMARRDAATELLRLLRTADRAAATWLTARETTPKEQTPAGATAFLPEETALALYLLDDRSIRSLLTLLDRVITDARAGAAGALGEGT